MGSHVVLRSCYAIRPISDYAEVELVKTSGYLMLTAYHTHRVYAVTGRNRWIASCLSFITFVQVAFGTVCAIYYALHPGTISFPALRSKLLRQTEISKALVFSNLPPDESWTCNFQPWALGEVIYFVLSLVYGTFFPSSAAHILAFDSPSVKDALALLIIVFSVKRHDGSPTSVGGVPNLLNKILQDATTYFLVLSAGHLLFVFFGVFAPVSDGLVDFRSITHGKIT